MVIVSLASCDLAQKSMISLIVAWNLDVEGMVSIPANLASFALEG